VPVNLWGRRRSALAMLLALTAAACGSTAYQHGKGLGAGGQTSAGNGLGAPGDSTASGAGGAASAASAGAPGASSSGRASGSAPGPVAPGSSQASGGGPSAAAHGSLGNPVGVTDTSIFIGLYYTVNGAAANQAIGGNGITQGDEKADQQILIDDINAHGGVAGRKLVPVWHQVDAVTTQTYAQIYQAMCADWTQDHHVFAAFGGPTDTLRQCLHNAGVLHITDDLTSSDSATFARFPYYTEISLMNLDRIAAEEVPALSAQGYFSGWDAALSQPGASPAKVGVLTYDSDTFVHAVKGVLLPALAGAGHPAADAAYVSYPQSQADAGNISAQVSSAILRFRQEGVDHVLVVDERALLTLFFLNQAESQHFFPRYGFNSQNGTEALLEPGDVPKEQVNGALGFGWAPIVDIPSTQDPDNGPYANDARRSCISLMKAHGQSYANPNAEAIALLNCNEFRLLKRALELGPTPISRDSFMAGLNRIGSSFQSTQTFAIRLDATHHDGAAAVRYWAYDGGCGCMRYTSGDQALP